MPLCRLADGQCTDAAVLTKMQDCIKAAMPTDAAALAALATDKTKQCDLQKKNAACQPACYCNDPTYKADIEKMIKQVETMSPGCTIKCGAASGLRASAFTIFIVAAVSIVASR
jgi:hypothetical protein